MLDLKKLNRAETGFYFLTFVFLFLTVSYSVNFLIKRSADNVRKADLNQIGNYLELNYFRRFSFPDSVDGHISDQGQKINWGQGWGLYTADLPLEAGGNLPYCYEKTATGFKLTAEMDWPDSKMTVRCNNKNYNYQLLKAY